MLLVWRAVVIGDGPLVDTTALIGLDDGHAPTPMEAHVPTLPMSHALRVSWVTLYRMLRRHDVY